MKEWKRYGGGKERVWKAEKEEQKDNLREGNAAESKERKRKRRSMEGTEKERNEEKKVRGYEKIWRKRESTIIVLHKDMCPTLRQRRVGVSTAIGISAEKL
jgi:hypothetical protein